MDILWIGYIFSIITIVGALLNAKHIIWCFPVWITANGLWIGFDIYFNTPSQIPVWVALTVTSVYGWWHWNKKGTKAEG